MAAPLAAAGNAATATRGATRSRRSRRYGLESGPSGPILIIPAAARAAATARRASERLVEAGVVEPLAAALRRGHGPTEPPENEEDEEDWDETVLFALAAQCCTRFLAEPRRRPSRRSRRQGPPPWQMPSPPSRRLKTTTWRSLCTPATPLSALFAHAATTSMVLDARACAVQQARDDDGVLQSFLDAGAVEACVAALDHPEREEPARRGRQLIVRVLLARRRASRVVRTRAGGVTKFVELLGEDPDDHTETAANDLFTATARVVEGLATDDGDRARCIGRGWCFAAAEARGC